MKLTVCTESILVLSYSSPTLLCNFDYQSGMKVE